MIEKFVRFIVDNSHVTLLLVLVLIFYGLSSINSLRIAQDPEVQSPKLWIELLLPGSSVAEMEKNVVFPIEDKLKNLHQIKTVHSKIDSQIAYIDVAFEFGADINEKVREIESKINNIKRTLPKELTFLVQKAVFSDIITAFLIGVNASSVDETEKIAHNLKDELQDIKSLKNIKIIKANENIVVSLDIEKLHWLAITPAQIVSAINSYNTFSPEGRLDISGKTIQLTGFKSFLKQPQDIGNVVIFTADGVPIKLSDVAIIEKRAQQNQIITHYQSKNTSLIQIGVDSQVNILTVREKIDKVIEKFAAGDADKFQLQMVFDQSEGVRNILYNLLISLLQGMGILILVLMFSVGYRSMFIVSTIIPLSFLFTVIGLSYTGYGIQQVSVAGFIIAMGLIVDNGIVVSENAFILRRYHGYSRSNAAITGTTMAISPLISSTLTTMLAFAPLFLLHSDEGLFLRSLTISIWFALGASLFIAMTLITLMLAKIGTNRKVPYLPTLPSFLIMLMPFRDKVYVAIIQFMIKFRYLTLLLFIAFLAYALHLASQLPVQIFPPLANPYFTINVNVPVGTSISKKKWIASEVETEVSQMKAIKSVTTVIGTEFPRLNGVINFKGDIIFLVKTDSGEESYLRVLIDKIKQRLQPLTLYADISLSLFQLQDMDYQSDFTLQITGKNTTDLKSFAKTIDPIIRQVEGVETIINPMKSEQTTLSIEFLSEQAKLLGVDKADVDSLIGMLTYGREIDRFRDDQGKEFPLLLKVDLDPNHPIDAFRLIEVVTQSGAKVPLSEIVKITFVPGESKLSHRQFKPVVEIDCYRDPNYATHNVAQAVIKEIQKRGVPEGIEVHLGGALKSSQQSLSGFGRNVLLIAALIFSIFVMQFRSFFQPFIIITAVPMCLIGALIALDVSGQTISFFAAVGITSLMGIVVNDSILLVDEGNKLLTEEPQKSIQEVAIEAGRKRFMPVILTSVTTIAGLIPLALAESMFQAMAIAIIGGLISSTFLILLLVPTLYSLLSRKSRL